MVTDPAFSDIASRHSRTPLRGTPPRCSVRVSATRSERRAGIRGGRPVDEVGRAQRHAPRAIPRYAWICAPDVAQRALELRMRRRARTVARWANGRRGARAQIGAHRPASRGIRARVEPNALLAMHEEAGRVASGVEHHPDSRSVAISRLVRSFHTSASENLLDGGIKVLDVDLEVHHLRLLPRLLGPRRRLVRALGLGSSDRCHHAGRGAGPRPHRHER